MFGVWWNRSAFCISFDVWNSGEWWQQWWQLHRTNEAMPCKLFMCDELERGNVVVVRGIVLMHCTKRRQKNSTHQTCHKKVCFMYRKWYLGLMLLIPGFLSTWNHFMLSQMQSFIKKASVCLPSVSLLYCFCICKFKAENLQSAHHFVYTSSQI